MTIETQRQILDLAERLERWEKSDLSRLVAARVYNNADLTLTTGATTTLTFNTERNDTDAFHSTVSNTGRLTVPVSGWYVIHGHVRFASNATGFRQARILLNGSTVIASDTRSPITGGATDIAITTQYYMTITHYVELQALQTSGGDLAVSAVSNFSPEFAISLIAQG